MALRDLWTRLLNGGAVIGQIAGGTTTRIAGPPPSGNGASSFHLVWEVPPVPLAQVEATVEVVEAPVVPRLSFWALQVDLQQGPSRRGGAHFGLQWHPDYPGNGAVNWGGYRAEGGELAGSVSDLPSALDNINTRTYRWEPGRRYRYRVHRSPDRGWRGTIVDETTGAETVVRDLWVEADHLVRPMVWSEVFADCDHPSAAVRWTDLTATTTDGEPIAVDTVRLNYQTHHDGGCANTDTTIERWPGGAGFVQRTNVERTNPSGSRLSLRQ